MKDLVTAKKKFDFFCPKTVHFPLLMDVVCHEF